MRGAGVGLPARVVFVLPAEPAAYARGLYRALFELDEGPAQRIVIELPPDQEEFRAVHDRLRRAAEPR